MGVEGGYRLTRQCTVCALPLMPKRPPALTAAHVARLAARDSQYDVRDGEIPGLLVRVFPSGAKRWGFRARQDGRLRFVLIGGYPELSLEVARKQARRVRGSCPVKWCTRWPASPGLMMSTRRLSSWTTPWSSAPAA